MTRELLPTDRKHGTNVGYSYYGCRCDACRGAHRLEMRLYWQTHPEHRDRARLRERRRHAPVRIYPAFWSGPSRLVFELRSLRLRAVAG